MTPAAAPATLTFASPDLLDSLDGLPLDRIDELAFGLIVFDRSDAVIGYNRYEAERTGLDPARVLGRDLFVTVAPCTNNYLVAERYRTDERLDEQLDYVFTFIMKPTPVRLRLLSSSGGERRYLAVVPR